MHYNGTMYIRMALCTIYTEIHCVFHEYGPECAVTTVDIQTPNIVQPQSSAQLTARCLHFL